MAEEIALNAEEPVAPVEAKKEEHHEDPTTISEYLESLLVTVLLALFGTSFVVQAFKIPSASMEGTLLIGDHLLVNKFIFGGSGAWYEKVLPYRPLEHGDIIVFKYPYADHQHFVKRVIGLPGDRLKLVDQQMYINGKLLNEPYVVHDPMVNWDPFNTSFPPRRDQMISPQVVPESGWRETLRSYVQGDELVVPPGKLFAMGDNRDHSSDSRYWGFVDRSAIMGRPFLIYWSVDATSNDYTQTTFAQRLMGVFDTLAHLPARTRWSRMLHTVH
ncbi:MAG: signal peptidase I [Candidatus Acidiferrum sp.]